MVGGLVGLNHWWMLLVILGQVYAPTFVPAAHLDARGQYVVVSASHAFGGARVYKFDGSTLSLKWSGNAVNAVIGDRYLWTEEQSPEKVCARALNTFTVVKCLGVTAPLYHMHFGAGTLYFDFEDVDYSGPNPGGLLDHVNVYAVKESAPTVRLVARDVGTTTALVWCSGPDSEYSYWATHVQHFSGVRSLSLRAEEFDLVSCATQNGHVAAVLDGHIWVDGKIGASVHGDIFPFPNGWLVSSGDSFYVLELNGSAVRGNGDKPNDLMFYRSDGPLFLRAKIPGR